MPTEPIFVTLRDDLIDSLEVMSSANGFWHDYAEVRFQSQAAFNEEKDPARPAVHLRWMEAINGDPRTGVQDAASGAAGRDRHYERFLVSASLVDTDGGDHERKAARFRADVNKALISTNAVLGLNRNRGVTRSNTYAEIEVEWLPAIEGGAVLGGYLGLVYVVRWDHVSGDMATG